MTITSDQLVERVDVYLAVDTVLNPAERKAFYDHVLPKYGMTGAEPADWISEADDSDAFLEIIEPWWEKAGALFLEKLVTRTRLPERLATRLLTAALYATAPLASLTLDGPGPRRSHIDIADEAADWVLAYAKDLGWTADVEAPAGDPVGAPAGAAARAKNAAEELPTVGRWPGDPEAT